MKEAIERNVRTAWMLKKAARSGKTETWKVVVEVVKAAGQDLLKEVSSRGIKRTVGLCIFHKFVTDWTVHTLFRMKLVSALDWYV